MQKKKSKITRTLQERSVALEGRIKGNRKKYANNKQTLVEFRWFTMVLGRRRWSGCGCVCFGVGVVAVVVVVVDILVVVFVDVCLEVVVVVVVVVVVLVVVAVVVVVVVVVGLVSSVVLRP
jgi:hypothetical protein